MAMKLVFESNEDRNAKIYRKWTRKYFKKKENCETYNFLSGCSPFKHKMASKFVLISVTKRKFSFLVQKSRN